jgi:hypothetical protein
MLPAFSNFSWLGAAQLPVPASVESPATMEAASAVKFTTAVETASTVESLTTVKTTAAMELAARCETAAEPAAVKPSFKPAAFPEDRTASAEARPEEPASAEAATEPRASSDEYASGEPIRAVVAIGGARIRVIAVVAISAPWAGSDVTVSRTVDRATDSDADHHSLRMGGNRRRKDANAQ